MRLVRHRHVGRGVAPVKVSRSIRCVALQLVNATGGRPASVKFPTEVEKVNSQWATLPSGVGRVVLFAWQPVAGVGDVRCL